MWVIVWHPGLLPSGPQSPDAAKGGVDTQRPGREAHREPARLGVDPPRPEQSRASFSGTSVSSALGQATARGAGAWKNGGLSVFVLLETTALFGGFYGSDSGFMT